MSKVIEIPDLKAARRTQLDDVTSAFYFSRLPREERIAKLMAYIFEERGGVQLTDAEWLEVGKKLASYAIKDFAVRPGRIDG